MNPTTVTPEQPEQGSPDDVSIEFPQANIVAVRAIATTLGSTLGPRCRDKLIVGEQADDSDAAPGTRRAGDVVVASDGSAILERLPIEHPVAPILRRMIGPERPGGTGVEGEDMPDGTTSRAVLSGALLDQAESLLERGLHPQTLISGFESAREIAVETVQDGRIGFEEFPDPHEARVATAATAMTGNVIGGNRETLASLVVEGVEAAGMPDEKSFDVRRTSDGSIHETRLIHGAVLGRSKRVSDEMPRRIEDASVLVLDGHDRGGLQERESNRNLSLDLESPAVASEVGDVRRTRKETIIDGFAEAGVDVVLTRLGIDKDYQRLLADAGMMGVRSVSPLDLARVARATGARTVMDPSDVTAADLGTAGTVTELSVDPYPGRRKRRRMIVFEKCPDPGTVTVLLRGVSGQVADQAATAVRKGAFAVGLAESGGPHVSGVVPGGGSIHVQAADAIRRQAREVDERSQIAMDAYADATDRLVGTLARNGGLDPLTVVPDIRSAQNAGTDAAGIVYPGGSISDCLEAGVLDPAAVVRDVYLYATDSATRLLRIDDAIDSVRTEDTVETEDVIYDEPAERQKQALDDSD